MSINHLELFSGIGGFRQALNLLCKDYDIKSNNIGFSEIDTYALSTYKANFDAKNELEMGDVVSFTESKINIKKISDVNFLSGGFPCQAFSMMGKQNGFNDMRGNVFFQIIKIISEKKPELILLENVKNITTHNKGKTFEKIINSIKRAGYQNIYYDVFNTRDFLLPQTRNRVYIVATRNKMSDTFVFNSDSVRKTFEKVKKRTSLVNFDYTYELLEKNVDEKYYLSEVIKPTILADGSKKFKSKSTIDQVIARPLTATMAKMHRACQDNYFSDDYINSDDPLEYSKLSFTKEKLVSKRIRRLTPKEAFQLQGFNEDFFVNAKSKGISDSQLYKQAGNAVSVNTVYAILYYLIIEHRILEV